MFEQSLLSSAGRNRRPKWIVLVSVISQFSLLGLLILLPLLTIDALPRALNYTSIGPPPGESPKPPAEQQACPRTPHHSDYVEGKVQAPSQIPPDIYVPPEPEPAILEPGGDGVASTFLRGIPGAHGVPGGTRNLMARVVEPPPLPKSETPPQPVRVGGVVQDAMALSRPQPVYPQLAKQARIQGVVRLEAIISKKGAIEDLKVVSGHTLLVAAALDAVRQWRYRPTILNNEPVEVITTIEVHFTLAQ